MKVDAIQRKVIFFAELRRFQDLFTRHAKLAVMLSGLGVSVMGVDGNPGEVGAAKKI